MKNCTYVLRTVLCIIMLTIAAVLPGYSQQIEKGMKASNGEYFGFLEYKPEDYASKTSTKYPLIIFLHGIGEKGNGTTQLKDVKCCGIPRIINKGNTMKFTWNGKSETFLVLSPQLPTSHNAWAMIFVEEMIAYAKKNLRVDANRIYLTGLSLGAGGAMQYISTSAEHAENLAAAATIAATCTFKQAKFPVDANLPLWAFHADDDPIVKSSCTESAIRKMNELNPTVKPLKTMWPTGGHIVWDRVYTDTNYRYQGVVNIYEWFLGQNKSWAPNKLPVANAGETISITAGEGVATLDASGSRDADGHIVRYVWKKIEGPAAGSITDAFGDNPTTTVTGLSIPGNYKFEVSVVDDRAAFTTSQVSVIVSSEASVENKKPVANAGDDIVITLPSNSINLSASKSKDADGSIVSYVWTKVSGPAVSILTPNIVGSVLNNLLEGTYTFKLKVTDNKGASDEDEVTVTVKAAPVVPNVAPVAKAGNDITITLPVNSITLDAGASTDSDGNIAKYLWTKITGSSASIVHPNNASTTVNNLTEGSYTFKIKVTDNKGATNEDQVLVVVKPEPVLPNVNPVADAGSDIVINLPLNTATLDGSGSDDEDGNIASYQWTKISGPVSVTITNDTKASASVSELTAGTYTFKLKVKDNKGATSEDVVEVKVIAAPNVKPVANAGNDIAITLPVNNTVLNGSGSTDADGTIESYAWSKISGPLEFIIAEGTLATTNLSNLSEGTYKFRLQTTDNKGGKDADTVTVTVNPEPPAPNVAPDAQAGGNKTIQLPVDHVTLNGSGSSDADGSIVEYGWSKIGGPATFQIADDAAASTNVNSLVQGTYSFRLEIKDNDGAISADTVTVTVKEAAAPPPPPNKDPFAKAGNDITITLPVNEVTLDGSTSIDIDGTLTNYSWSKVSGPAQFRLTKPSYHITKIENLIEGTYSFRLQVKDNDGALGFDTINITVLHAINVKPVSKAGSDIEIQLPVNSADLSGTDSYDPDGNVSSYKWEFAGGPTGSLILAPTASTTTITSLTAGEYSFRLIVTDNEGATASDIVKVKVLPAPPNEGPVAQAGADVEVSLPTSAIKLDGSASFDTDGTIEKYSWVKTSGAGGVTIVNSSTARPTIVGVVSGVYVFRLTVTDNDGAEATDVVKLTVLPEPPPAVIENIKPFAIAGDDQSIAYPESSVTLTGNDSYDEDGNIASYEWKLISGPSTPTIVTPFFASTVINHLETGEYMFELIATDDKGASDRDTISISVINTMRYQEAITVFPNPARSTVNVQMISDTTGNTKVTIYNAAGNVVKTYSKNKSQAEFFESINVANLQTGMYYLEVIIDGKERKITKFIKQ